MIDQLAYEAKVTNIATSDALERLKRLKQEIEYKHK
jgi:hypothetical protein